MATYTIDLISGAVDLERLVAERGADRAIHALVQNAVPALPGQGALIDRLVVVKEAMSWIYSLREYHKKRLGTRAFHALCERDPAGTTLRGLVWARGLIEHHLVNVTVVRYGTSRSVGWVEWVPSEELVAGARSERADPVGRAAYDERLAGERLVDPPIDAYSFLTNLPSSADPPIEP